MRRLARVVTVGVVAVALGTPVSARGEEAKTPVSAALLLGIVARPVERPEVAFEKSLRDDGPAVANPATAGEVQPDGSVRYGRLTVTVKNPCPPGTEHYEAPPLPGRRARR
jgi:hypothetical protein